MEVLPSGAALSLEITGLGVGLPELADTCADSERVCGALRRSTHSNTRGLCAKKVVSAMLGASNLPSREASGVAAFGDPQLQALAAKRGIYASEALWKAQGVKRLWPRNKVNVKAVGGLG